MATPKNTKTAPKATTPAPAGAAAQAPAAKQSGFERGKGYNPELAITEIDLSEVSFRKRGVQQDSKYKPILEQAASLAVGKAFVVEEEKADVKGKDLFNRLSPYIRRHALTANKNGGLKVWLDNDERVIIGCVDRAEVKPPRKRTKPVEAPATAPAATTA